MTVNEPRSIGTHTQPFRQLRRATGLGLREVSRRSGINRGRLSVIERGVMPTPDEAARIIAALTLPPDMPAA